FEDPPLSNVKMQIVKVAFQAALLFLKPMGADVENPFYRSVWRMAAVRSGELPEGASPLVKEAEVYAPRAIIFKPVVTNSDATSSDPTIDFRDKLASLTAGDVLFEVVAKGRFMKGESVESENPADVAEDEVPIGRLVLESEFSASS